MRTQTQPRMTTAEREAMEYRRKLESQSADAAPAGADGKWRRLGRRMDAWIDYAGLALGVVGFISGPFFALILILVSTGSIWSRRRSGKTPRPGP